ncbi:MAG: amidohydrolase, partial [Pygmaiobacter sp.]
MSETIYFGGPIITMETPVLPEAVLVQNGRIAGIGDLYDLREVAPDAKLYDLCGHTMLPAFIDAHSHITN